MTDLEYFRAMTVAITRATQDFSELIVKLACEECSGQGVAKIPAAGPDPVCPACNGMGVKP